MKKLWLLSLCGLAGLLSAALILLSGCGGGGGPITGPETGPDPSISAQFLALLPTDQKDATYVGAQSCLTAGCHNDNIHSAWQNTKHAAKGVGCEQCHGPGSFHVTNRKANLDKADILTFPQVNEPLVCGQCHGPTFEQYKNSRHSGVVDEVIEEAHSLPDRYGRSCTRCHATAIRNEFISPQWTEGLKEGKSITQIQDEADARINALTNDVIGELAEASHQSATCVTCHSPHTQTGILTSAGNEAHLRRATFSKDVANIQPGTPIKIHSNFNHICGTCHNGRGGKNDDATLNGSTARPSYHENPQFNMLLGVTGVLPPGVTPDNSSHQDTPDQCVHCHMPDKRHTFTVSPDRSCQPCHTADDAFNRANTVQTETLNRLLTLRTRMERWAQTKFGNPNFWTYSSLVSEDSAVQAESAAIQKDIPIEVKRARHNYYFIVRDKSRGVHNTKYTRQLLTYAEQQLDAAGISRSVRIDRSVKQFEQLLKQDRIREILSESRWTPDRL